MSAAASLSTAPAPAPRLPVSLQTRLLLGIGGFVIVAGVLLGIAVYLVVSASEFRTWQSRTRDAAVIAAQRVEDFNQQIVDQIQLIDNLILGEAILGQLDVPLVLLNLDSPIDEIVLVDIATEQVLQSAARDFALISETLAVEDFDWFADARDGTGREELVDGIYIGELEVSEGGQISLVASSRLSSDIVVGVRVDMTVLSEIVQGIDFAQSGEVYVTEAEGELIAHNNLDLVREGIELDEDPLFQRAIAGGLSEMQEYINFQGADVFGLAREVEGTDWWVFTEVPIGEAQAEVSTIVVTVVLLIAGVVVAITGYVAYIIRRDIITRLRRLQAGAAEIGAGRLGTQVMLDRQDELGDVVGQFNAMSSQLAARADERNRMISDLEFARRMAEENSRLKSEFLSMMSHELRTPMNAIEGFTSIMLSGMGGVEYNDKAERYITRVNVNSKRLLQLINDFLDLSRVESGRLTLANHPFDPAELARRWQTEIGVLADSKGIGFEVVIDPALPAKVYGDEEAISKVAINLLGNAIKFTEQGKVTLTLERGPDEWRIIVRDTGIGIPPHAREFVFEEFRQVDQSSRRKFGGTGLGLAIVQKYTRSLGGTVGLESEVGVGSTFTVRLPLQAEPLIAGGA